MVARGPDGVIKLFCKGADSVLMQRLDPATPADLVAATNNTLRVYSIQVLFSIKIPVSLRQRPSESLLELQ